ncbi:MAG TPA: alpha-L-fucosidase [Bryobacteraceae bacterium]|jgi:alpha-L-fucosidase
MRRILIAAAALMAILSAQNRPERLEWFRDLGFGLFIHWSFDSQVGTTISHSMVGASDDYLSRFVNDLPRTFNPHKFDPKDWAALAKIAGIKYVIFTSKHHSGFCMFPTNTTDFNIMHTPFHRDIVGAIVDAFREQGIAPGLYFSPDDFWWLYKNGKTITRNIPAVQPSANAGLLAHDTAQVTELMSNYGPIDVLFFDGEADALRQTAWKIQPNVVVTRGAMETPEQYIPGVPLEGPWEANMTMGTNWAYKPTNEIYKSGGQLISTLIETRAKGGNFLLNVGPKPDGELPIEQEDRLREMALWMSVNSESIYGVRPWILTNEHDYWFTKSKDGTALYVFIKQPQRWPYGQWKDIVLKSVRATDRTTASVLGQNDKVLEYQANVVPKTTWKQEPDGLHIRAMRAQRLYDDRKWPNAVVLKLTAVEPALVPPVVETVRAHRIGTSVEFEANLIRMGDSTALDVGFEYRVTTGQDANERTGEWIATPVVHRLSTGVYAITVNGLDPAATYEFRASARHPLLTFYGAEKNVPRR